MNEIQFWVRYLRDIKDGKLHLAKALGPFETADQAKQVAFGILQQLASWWVMVCEKPGSRADQALWSAALRFDVSPDSWGASEESQGMATKDHTDESTEGVLHQPGERDGVRPEIATLADRIFQHQFAFEFPECRIDSISVIPAGEASWRAFLNTAEQREELDLLTRVAGTLGLL